MITPLIVRKYLHISLAVKPFTRKRQKSHGKNFKQLLKILHVPLAGSAPAVSYNSNLSSCLKNSYPEQCQKMQKIFPSFFGKERCEIFPLTSNLKIFWL